MEADPVLGGFLRQFGPAPVRLGKYEGELFAVLTNAILAQQISVRAAESVQAKFVSAFVEPGESYPSPEALAQKTVEELRAVGFSRQKAGYVIGIAQAVLDGLPTIQALEGMSDEEVMETLLPLKGVGKWTVEMLLIFRLGRPDVFPIDDLAVRAGMRIVYGLPPEATRAEMTTIAEGWRPYRSFGSWYMWRAIGFRPEPIPDASLADATSESPVPSATDRP